jgi:uncharacterized protein (TIGR00251 family)
VLIRIHALPNAKKSEVVGWEDDPRLGKILRVKIAAPPLEGKANEALRSFLAAQLGISKSRIQLEKGGASRFKAFEVPEMALPWPF